MEFGHPDRKFWYKMGKKYRGHNPMGGLVSEAAAATITELHHLNFDVVTGLLVLHIGAIIFYRLYKKEKLIAAMFSGKKDTDAAEQKSAGSSRLILAAIVLACCAAGVYMLANTSLETEQSTTDYDFY